METELKSVDTLSTNEDYLFTTILTSKTHNHTLFLDFYFFYFSEVLHYINLSPSFLFLSSFLTGTMGK